MSVPVFSMKGITAGYDDVPVLRGITADIPEGSFVAIIGPNGSGKSTLLKVLSGTMAFGGSLLFLGRRLGELRTVEVARRRSVVHQFLEYRSPYSVREFVALGRFPHHDRGGRGEIDRAMELTGVTGLADRRITELSGGELQLVRIAGALAQNSGIVLLDEPVSHLDMRHSLKVMDTLYDLYRHGSTIVTVLHDINMASDYSSLVMGIRGGEVAFYDAPEQVMHYDRLESLYGARCVTRTNPISGRPFNYPVPGHLMGKE